MAEFTFSLKDFELFLLVLMRIASFVSVAPFLGMSNTPNRVKIGLSFFVALVVNQIIPMEDVEYSSILGYSAIVLQEVVCGLILGFSAYICTTIIYFAGSIMDMDMGLSMATMFDPTTKTQSTITGTLYNYILLLLLLISDMHVYLLGAIVDSYRLIPVGGVSFRWDSLLQSMIKYMTDSVVIAFRIVLPVFVCIMILNCVLGIMAKVSPQMNMFSIGMQLKLLVGFVVIYLVVSLMPHVANYIFKEVKVMIVSVMRGMY